MYVRMKNTELVDKLVVIADGNFELVQEAIRHCADANGGESADLKAVVEYIVENTQCPMYLQKEGKHISDDEGDHLKYRALLRGVKIAEADLKEAGVLLEGVVPGLKDVQKALPTRNPWAVLNFLVRADDRLDGRKPIEVLLNGDVDLVVSAARSMGEQGG